jgi:O-antigen ligase
MFLCLVTFHGSGGFFLGVYVLVLRRFFIEQKDLGRFFSVLFFFAGFEALYGLLQALIPKLGVLWETGTAYSGLARGTFVNRNHFASFMGMVWPLPLAYSLSLTSQSEKKTASSFRETERNRRNRQEQSFLSFIIGMVLLSLFFSMSRGGILSSLVALTVFVILEGAKQKGTLSFVATSWMIMIGYGCIIGFDQIMLRFDMMENDAPGRLNIWQEAWQIIQDHPLMGAGLGSCPEIGSLYQVHLSDTLRTSHVHNDYLQLITDLGVPVAVGMHTLESGLEKRHFRRPDGSWNGAEHPRTRNVAIQDLTPKRGIDSGAVLCCKSGAPRSEKNF